MGSHGEGGAAGGSGGGAGGGQEMLCLRWEDFNSHFSTSFRQLRESKSTLDTSFYDVSLAVGDGSQLVPAHKLILSSCSPLFRNILARQAKASPLAAAVHPVIYLRGVKLRDVRNVLDFMYQGEVNVAQEHLDSFLAVAEDLKVRGLTQGSDQEQQDVKPKMDSQGVKRSAQSDSGGGGYRKRPAMGSNRPQASRPRPPAHHSDNSNTGDDIEIVPPIKQEEHGMGLTGPHQGAAEEGYDDGGGEDYGDGQGYEDYAGGEGELDYVDEGGDGQAMAGTSGGEGGKDLPLSERFAQYASESTDRTAGGIVCMLCGKVIKHESNLKRHFMVAHSGDNRRYLCPFCQREYKNRHSFSNHVYSTHPEYKGLSIDRYAVDNNGS